MSTTLVDPTPVAAPSPAQEFASQKDAFKSRLAATVATPVPAAPAPEAPPAVPAAPVSQPGQPAETPPVAAQPAAGAGEGTLESRTEDDGDIAAQLAEGEPALAEVAPEKPAATQEVTEERESDLDKFFKGPRGQRIYAAYKRQSAMTEHVGYQPSPEEVESWINAQGKLDDMTTDFRQPETELPEESDYRRHGLTSRGERWLAYHFGPALNEEGEIKVDAKGNRVYSESATDLAARLPEFLDQYNPKAAAAVTASVLRKYQEKIRTNILENPEYASNEQVQQLYTAISKQIERDAQMVLKSQGYDPEKPLVRTPEKREPSPLESDFRRRVDSAVQANRVGVINKAMDVVVKSTNLGELAPSVLEGVKFNFRGLIAQELEKKVNTPAFRMFERYEKAARSATTVDAVNVAIGRARTVLANMVAPIVERERARFIKELGAKARSAVPNTTVHQQAQRSAEVPKGPAAPVPAAVGPATPAASNARVHGLGSGSVTSLFQDRLRAATNR